MEVEMKGNSSGRKLFASLPGVKDTLYAMCGHGIVSVMVVGLLALGWLYFRSYAEVSTNALRNRLDAPSSTGELPDGLDDSLDSRVALRLREQYEYVRTKQAHHLEVTAIFYKNYYLSLSMAMFAGFAATCLLAVVSKQGWAATSPFAVTAFSICFGVASLYALFPAVFRQRENVEENAALVREYGNLAEEIRTFALLGCELPKVREEAPCSPAAVVREIDVRGAALNRIAIGFDAARLTNPVGWTDPESDVLAGAGFRLAPPP